MSKRRRKSHKLLGISDKGWSTIGTGFKWYLIAGGIMAGVGLLIVGGIAVAGMSSMSGPMGAVRQLQPPVSIM